MAATEKQRGGGETLKRRGGGGKGIESSIEGKQAWDPAQLWIVQSLSGG